MTPPDRHKNAKGGPTPPDPNPETTQNRSPETGWRATALGADQAVRSGVDRVRPHAHRAWQRILPLVRRLWLALLPLVRRVRGSAAWRSAEQRVRPVASDSASRFQATAAASEEDRGHRRPEHTRLRAMKAGAALAALGVVGLTLISVATGSQQGGIRKAAHDIAPASAASVLGPPNGPDNGSVNGGDGGEDADKQQPPPAPGPPAQGIDVSNHNGKIDWKKVAASGQNFAFVLASDGADFTSPRYAEQYHGAKNAGMIAGAYHFARPDESAQVQADKLLAVADYKKDGKTLPPVLDLEPDSSGDTCYGLNSGQMHQWTKTFNDRIKQATGVEPIIYANPSFWKQCMNGSNEFASHPLWLASYGVNNPTPPPGFDTWNFWQYTDKGTVPGVSGKVDRNHFNGSVGDLMRLTETG